MSPKYNTAVVRELIQAVFSDEDLRITVYDSDDFRPVYNQFAIGMPMRMMVHKLIEYAEQYERLDELLEIVRQRNEEKYREFEPRLLKSASGVIERPRTPGLSTAGWTPSTFTAKPTQPAEDTSTFAPPQFTRIRLGVDRLSAYTKLFDETEEILNLFGRLSEAAEHQIQIPLAEWKGDARLDLQYKLIPSFDDLSMSVTRHRRNLDNAKEKLLDEHRDSVTELADELRQAQEVADVEEIKKGLRNSCAQIAKTSGTSAEAEILAQCHGQLKEGLVNLINAADSMCQPTRHIRKYLYEGIRQCVKELATLIGT